MNPAQSAREAKQRWPEDFCEVKDCLWRIYTARGVNPCRKHSSGAERTTVSYGGSHSDVASEPDGERARSTVRLATEREVRLQQTDHTDCDCRKCGGTDDL